MHRRNWLALAALTAAVAMLASAKDDKPAAKEATDKDLFGLTKVHAVHLELTAKDYDTMQPAGRGGFPGGLGGFPGTPAAPAKPDDKPSDVHKGSGFGLEYPIVHAVFTADGQTVKNIGLRYKGNASYMASSRGLKRNFKVELDHYDDTLRYCGQKKINLNAGAMDPTKGREALSYAVFRAAGVPAPRTAFAEVTLTIPGKYDKEYLGLYTVIEQVDKAFLKDRFKNAKGLLMKPEGVRGVEYMGDNWQPYAARYKPKHDPSKEESKRVIDFARLVHRGDDAQFKKEIGSYLDVDEFLRFLAVNALVVNIDSFFMMGHNYYIYLNPETNKFVFIPWDLDLSLAGFPMMGADQINLSLTHPHAGENKLIDRLLAIKEVNEQYQKLLKELSATCFSKEKLLKDVAEIEKTIKEPLVREKKAAQARKEGGGGIGFGPPGGGFGQGTSLTAFVEKRTESVVAQLDGKSKGFVPSGFGPPGGGPGGPGGFGPGGPGGFGPGGFGPPPQSGQVLPQPLQDQLRLTAEQSKELEELQKDVDARLAKILTAEQKKQLKDIRDGRGRGGFGPGGFGPGGPPGGFGLGNLLARPVLMALDTDKDGKVSKDELLAGVKSFFKDADKDKKGHLDQKQIAEALSRIFPQPPGGGPGGPGFGPGGVIAGEIVKRADADKNGEVTLDELVAAAEALFKEADKDKKGKLDEPALAAAINLLVPPPNFGPPGFGPPPGDRPREPRKP